MRSDGSEARSCIVLSNVSKVDQIPHEQSPRCRVAGGPRPV